MRVIGAIFPLPERFVDRIFKQGRNVFVKPPTVYRDLGPGSKILFYVGGEVGAIVGEGTAESVELMEPERALKKYGKKIFLDAEELREYLRGKKRVSKILVIPLRDPKLYNRPYKPRRFISMAGRRVTEGEYRKIASTVF